MFTVGNEFGSSEAYMYWLGIAFVSDCRQGEDLYFLQKLSAYLTFLAAE